MTARPRFDGARIDSVEVRSYSVPTSTEEESDGTLVWGCTTLVVVQLRCGTHTGLGYTYCHPAAGQIIESKLAGILTAVDPLMPETAWAQMQMQSRQMGHAGIAAMAISAVDVALWDLKAKLLGVCLADALPRFRERVELVRSVVGDGVEIMVDANGANHPQDAVWWAQRYRELGVTYFEEPVSSDDLRGLAYVREHAPAGLAVAAGEYGWNLPYYQRMLDAGAVHILQADVTRCGGITNLVRIDGLCKARCLQFSAHCAPAISAHVCCGMETVVHVEYFHDHYRIESLLFDGTLDPAGGLLEPDRSRPGLGLELKHADARRYEI
jgi:L-alanine-DL-glutamate epimerase-like enolase superfamily enzyme